MSAPDWNSARPGCCDFCLSYDHPVLGFSGEDPVASCEGCYRDMEVADRDAPRVYLFPHPFWGLGRTYHYGKAGGFTVCGVPVARARDAISEASALGAGAKACVKCAKSTRAVSRSGSRDDG